MSPSDLTPANAPRPLSPAPADSQRVSMAALMSLAQAGEAPSAGPPALSAAPTLSGLAQALRRRWLVAAVLSLAGLTIAVAGVFLLMPPKYLATLRFRVAARADQQWVAQFPQDDPEFILVKASQQNLVASPIVLNAALASRLPDGREVRDLAIVRDKGPRAVEWLEKNLKTDFNLGPEILKVTLGADDPEEAAALLNAIGTAFLAENDKMERSRREQRLEEYKKKRNELEEELRGYRQQHNSKVKALDIKDKDATAQQYNQVSQELAAAKARVYSLYAERDKAQADIVGLEAKGKLIDQLPVPAEKLAEALKADQLVAAYEQRLVDHEANIQYFREKLVNPDKHIQEEREKIADVNARLKQLRDKLRPQVEARYRDKVKADVREGIAVAKEKLSYLETQEKTLNLAITDLSKELKKLLPANQVKSPDVVNLEDKIESTASSLRKVSETITLMSVETPKPRVTPLQAAVPPSDKDVSRQTKLAGAGGLGMFGLILFAVAFVEFQSRKISGTDEVEHGLGLSVVGTLPAIPAKARAALVGSTPDGKALIWQNQLNESVDAVRTLLLHASRTDALRVIMVTSANGGEGKTSVASQLAASLARAWRKTLLIDGDLRHPAAHNLFGAALEPGLSEVLRGEVAANDAVRATPLSRLWLLPAGNWDSHAVQALAQDDVGSLLEQLKQQYDFIVIDSPPILPVTDGLLLGQHVDGVIFSILRDVSRAPAVYAAQQKLTALGVRTLGAVMIGATGAMTAGSYQYAASTPRK